MCVEQLEVIWAWLFFSLFPAVTDQPRGLIDYSELKKQVEKLAVRCLSLPNVRKLRSHWQKQPWPVTSLFGPRYTKIWTEMVIWVVKISGCYYVRLYISTAESEKNDSQAQYRAGPLIKTLVNLNNNLGLFNWLVYSQFFGSYSIDHWKGVERICF